MMILASTMDSNLLEITRHLPMREIKRGVDPYIERYYVGQNEAGAQTWLHRFLGFDGDEFFHSHPWYANSTIICGGYTEESATLIDLKNKKSQRFGVGDKNIINPETLHKISSVDKYTWSVMQIRPGWVEWFFINSIGGLVHMGKTTTENWWKDYGPREVKK